MSDVLISLEERHAESILRGQKHVEFRRRPMDVPNGTTVWIYVKKPLGVVIGYARVRDAYALAPNTLWKRFSQVSGLTRQEFFGYLDGVSVGFALALEGAERLQRPITLQALRNEAGGFHPPQFFMRLGAGSALLKALMRAKNDVAYPSSRVA